MADIEEIVEEPRTVEGDDTGQTIDRDLPHRKSTKRKLSKKSRNSADSVQTSPLGNDERRKENGDRRRSDPQPVDIQQEVLLPVREEYKTKFYEDYREVAKDYDKEFIKKYDEDLNTTLIFAGLFSAVTSAFIIQVDSQLQPDPGDETVALLRILIYQMNNTAFGHDVPTLPQWTGPPPTMVQVQAILISSLAASLLSAFLAMLGKQWLNRYESTDLRGSVIERGQNRQRKLDGINKWYFDFVMESLSLMLQVALLLLGCALSRYFWETSIAIASVVVAVTSFGLLFYFFILVAGTDQEFREFLVPFATEGQELTGYYRQRSIPNVLRLLRDVVFIPFMLVGDCVILVLTSYRPAFRMLNRLGRTTLTPEQQQTALDLQCISWTLQTSLEEPVRCSIMKHLTTIAASTDFDRALIMACFDNFVRCLSVSNGKAVVVQGFDQLATLSAECFFQILRHLSATRPTSSVLRDLNTRYGRTFPPETDFQGLPFYRTLANIHVLARKDYFGWAKGHDQKLIPFTRCMVEAAQAEYDRTQNKRMPRWILRFALRFLSRNNPSPTSVIADCLTIVAIALDLDLSSVSISDDSARVELVSSLIIQTLETMAGAPDADPIFQSKRKAINALFPYAIHLSQGGQQRMVDTILRVASKPSFTEFMWHRIGPYMAKLFDESSPPSWNELIINAAPFADWEDSSYTQNSVARWAVAVFPTPYTEEIGQSVVNALLQIASFDFLRPQIPIYVWLWLKRRPSLPPVCDARADASESETVRHIRGLGDLEILKSYFLLIWSEWNCVFDSGLTEMEITIQEKFCGAAMGRHREDLAERLDHILERLDQGLEYFKEHGQSIYESDIRLRKKDYRRLKKVLREVDRSAREVLPEP